MPREWVHPRVRGETIHYDIAWPGAEGPSPRARGNLQEPRDELLGDGSIPACAGKPTVSGERLRPTWVHPRVRGETANNAVPSGFLKGPSPRARGNLRRNRS